VYFLLLASKRIGTDYLACKKGTPFSKNKMSLLVENIKNHILPALLVENIKKYGSPFC